MPVKIVTDSAADLPTETAAAQNIAVVPLTIRFGDEEYVDGVELSAEAFYARMAELDVLPATAAPSPGAFEEAFRAAGADGDQVVCVSLSSKISATMQSAEAAVKAIGDELDVRVVDSESVSAGHGSLVLHAAEVAASGASAEEVVSSVEKMRDRTHVLATLDTLDNLKKGGRIGGAQALIGSILSIKPIIDLSTGEVAEAGKQRTRKKALASLRDTLFEQGDLDQVAIAHGFATDIDDMIELLAPRYSQDQITTWTIGPVVGSHGGAGVIGVVWLDPA